MLFRSCNEDLQTDTTKHKVTYTHAPPSLTTHTHTHTEKHPHCRTPSDFIIFFLSVFFSFLWRGGEGEKGVFHSSSFVAAGERDHISIHNALPCNPIHTHTYTHTQTHIKAQTLPKDYLSHILAAHSGFVSLPEHPSWLATLGMAQAFLPSSFHTWRGSLSPAIADKLQTRLSPPLLTLALLSLPLFFSTPSPPPLFLFDPSPLPFPLSLSLILSAPPPPLSL